MKHKSIIYDYQNMKVFSASDGKVTVSERTFEYNFQVGELKFQVGELKLAMKVFT